MIQNNYKRMKNLARGTGKARVKWSRKIIKGWGT
jgi:hypothetical protein